MLATTVAEIRANSGARRPMGASAPEIDRVHYHLLRRFKGDVDLLMILNTKRCKYNCAFCDLPEKSSQVFVPGGAVLRQVEGVYRHYADSLDVVDRVSLSNEGSVLDGATLPHDVLLEICDSVAVVPGIGRLVLETRLEFLTVELLTRIRERLGDRCRIDLLTGLETQDDGIRNGILAKRQSRAGFLEALDIIALVPGVDLTSYVMLKPDYRMSDSEAVEEAMRTVDFLRNETATRGLVLGIRLNPTYVSAGTRWAAQATEHGYHPPRLSDVLKVAAFIEDVGVPVYIGLSDEGLADSDGTFRIREDFDREVLRRAIIFNAGRPFSGHLVDK